MIPSGCRRLLGCVIIADDNEETLRARLLAYYKETSPLIGFYYAKDNLVSVDGMQDMQGVTASIETILNERA